MRAAGAARRCGGDGRRDRAIAARPGSVRAPRQGGATEGDRRVQPGRDGAAIRGLLHPPAPTICLPSPRCTGERGARRPLTPDPSPRITGARGGRGTTMPTTIPDVVLTDVPGKPGRFWGDHTTCVGPTKP